MRTASLVAAGLVTALALPASAANGPFTGNVGQGETRTHVFDNYPKTGNCLQYTTGYRVAISHVPPGNVLTLTANGRTATSTGSAAVSFESGVCTRFDITVTGTSVANRAHYVVTVVSGPLGSLGDLG